MFDIGFWELTTIAVIALLVIGPDKLPGVARTAGKWVGRARRFVGDVKTDIDRELKQEELKKAIADDVGLDEIKEIMNTDDFKIEEDETPAYQVSAIPDSSDDFDKDDELKNITGHSDIADSEPEDDVVAKENASKNA